MLTHILTWNFGCIYLITNGDPTGLCGRFEQLYTYMEIKQPFWF